MKPLYVTTAIDYVNSLPHLGTAYEKIGADVLARFYRMEGREVHFQMGNDEHSVNVKKEADRRKLSPKIYCDEMKGKFEAIWKNLQISYDDFIQTSEPRHHQGVAAFLKAMNPADLTKAPYEGWYCESCEAFFTEKDLVEGLCPTHKTKPNWLHEENYFFTLSKYQQRLLDHYEKHPEFILPEVRRNEVMQLVRSGLQDISISRSGFSWGIPFPSDPKHVVYVWFDALINYLSAVGYGQSGAKSHGLFKKQWPADLHIVGKDITRFHCVIWPAMLMSAGLPLPKTVFGHGFIFLKGEKMSKSLGNIVTPLDVVPQYGSDALRYYLLRESSFGSDGDFTWDNFIKRYNSDLANDLGNLLNRTLGMATKYLDGTITQYKSTRKKSEEDERLKKIVTETFPKVREALDYQKVGDIGFHKALLAIWELIGATDKYIDSSAPWKLAKEEKKEEIVRVLYRVVDTIRNISLLIAPFLPETSRNIWEQLCLDGKLKWEEQNFKNIQWGKTPSVKVTVGRPIFPRIDLVEGAETGLPGTDNRSRSDAARPLSASSPHLLSEGCREMGLRKLPASPAPAPSVTVDKKENKMEIDITEFQKIELKVAEVKQAEKVAGADRLLKLQVDLGGELRQIVAGIAQHYTPEQMIGKKVVVVANLKPAVIRGVESHGMLLAASNPDMLTVLTLDRDLSAGAKVK